MIGERLKEQRKANGDTQQTLAQKLGVRQATIAFWECDKATPNNKILVEICRLYNISADYLLGLTNKPRNLKNAMDDRQQVIESIMEYIKGL